MNKIKKLEQLLEKHNVVIATHKGADYSYIIFPDMMAEGTRIVNLEELPPADVEYFISRLERKSYPQATRNLEFRCSCNKLLFKDRGLEGSLDIKCPRCGEINKLNK